MKQPATLSLRLAVLATIALATPALAVVSMSWTNIGNANNLADPATGYGSVDHAYRIGTYEVTNAQYVDFLNAKGSSNSAGIYNGTMGSYGITQSGSSSYSYSVSSAYANMPVVGVTWFDAARFCNWLGNGQGNGSMEIGAYSLNGATTGIVTANVGATVYIPTENEWYKAAYYNGATSTYSLYPNGKNTITGADANFYNPGLADVGYGTPSSYGTYGQGGNAWEWNDAVIVGNYSSGRGLRGGSYLNYGYVTASTIRYDYFDFVDPGNVGRDIGFRVASVPEPTAVVLTMLACGVLLIRRKR